MIATKTLTQPEGIAVMGMKVIIQDTYGSADVLHLRDTDKPTIGDDEVLLRVRAASVVRGVSHRRQSVYDAAYMVLAQRLATTL